MIVLITYNYWMEVNDMIFVDIWYDIAALGSASQQKVFKISGQRRTKCLKPRLV